MSITIDLPAPVLAALQEESDATGQPIEQIAAQIAADAIAQRFAVFSGGKGPDMAIVALVEEGLADAQAGRLLTFEQVEAHAEAALAQAQERRFQQAVLDEAA